MGVSTPVLIEPAPKTKSIHAMPIIYNIKFDQGQLVLQNGKPNVDECHILSFAVGNVSG